MRRRSRRRTSLLSGLLLEGVALLGIFAVAQPAIFLEWLGARSVTVSSHADSEIRHQETSFSASLPPEEEPRPEEHHPAVSRSTLQLPRADVSPKVWPGFLPPPNDLASWGNTAWRSEPQDVLRGPSQHRSSSPPLVLPPSASNHSWQAYR